MRTPLVDLLQCRSCFAPSCCCAQSVGSSRKDVRKKTLLKRHGSVDQRSEHSSQHHTSHHRRNAEAKAMVSSPKQTPALLELPEVLLYSIVSFVAGPTHRAHVVCHELAPLSRIAADALLEKNATLWEALLEGDYGVKDDIQHTANTRRALKRRRESPLFRVRDAHLMVVANTDLAYYYLEEMTNSTTKSLTQSRLYQLMEEYGPHLRVNDRTKTGGTFLVACCRARDCRESDILKCVKLLVEIYHADLDLFTLETAQSSLTPLCVAAARGMSTIVKYLLLQGASPVARGTGRFRLHTNKRKSVKFIQATPLEFAETMKAAEVEEGASMRDVKDLDKCIRQLRQSQGQR